MDPEQIICYKYYYVRIFDCYEQYGPFISKEAAEIVRKLIVSWEPYHYNGRNYISEYHEDEAGAEIQTVISEEKLSSTIETVESFLSKTDKIKDATLTSYNISVQWTTTGSLKIYANNVEEATTLASEMIRDGESKIAEIAFNPEYSKGSLKII
jgi:hypothetical protein